MKKLALAITATVLICACGRQPDQERASVVRDSAGITIVESARPRWQLHEQWRVSPTPLVEIGVSEGDPDYELYGARSSVRLSDGTVVVANCGAQELRWYDEHGVYLRTVGRQGGGPGEFEGLERVAVEDGDSVVAYDSESNRISVFSPSGFFERSVNLTGPRGFFLGVVPDGSFLIWSTSSGGLVEGLSRWSSIALRYAVGGDLLDTLGVFPGIEWFTQVTRSGAEIQGVVSLSRPFAKSTSFAVWGDFLFVGTQDRYEIAAYVSDGRPVYSIRRDWPGVRVTDADIEAYKEADLADYTDPDERRQRAQELESLPYPDVMPAYGAIEVDAVGNLWVADYRRRAEDRLHWTVFDRSYEMLGTVETPAGFAVHQIGTDFLLGRHRDVMGVERILVYVLEKP